MKNRISPVMLLPLILGMLPGTESCSPSSKYDNLAELKKEYDLIKAKKSKLGANQRADIVWLYENAK